MLKRIFTGEIRDYTQAEKAAMIIAALVMLALSVSAEGIIEWIL